VLPGSGSGSEIIHSGSDSGSGSTTLPGRVCVSALQQSVCSRGWRYFTWTYLFISRLCYARRYMTYSSLCCSSTVCLQEPVLHLYVNVYENFVQLLDLYGTLRLQFFCALVSESTRSMRLKIWNTLALHA